jgi:hypothetical protein
MALTAKPDVVQAIVPLHTGLILIAYSILGLPARLRFSAAGMGGSEHGPGGTLW